jgi:hypothetical protein
VIKHTSSCAAPAAKQATPSDFDLSPIFRMKHEFSRAKRLLFPWISPRSASVWKSILGVYISRQPFSFTFARTYRMDQFLYICDVDAEPLHRYRRGGYHPIRLGDLLKDGGYKILHKLDWSGYSTVWAARGQRFYLSLPLSRYEAYKNC